MSDRIYRNSLTTENGCWEWTGSTRHGYGRITVGSRRDGPRAYMSTHRYSWEVHYGEIPAGMYVCHKCDNRRCVNPDHLFLGTAKDNAADRESKGRNNHVVGERIGTSKLKVGDINVIRNSSLPSRVIASEYGVNKSTILDVRSGRRWAHVPCEPPKESSDER